MAKARKAAKVVVEADRDVTHRAATERGHPLTKALGSLSEVADQPPLIALAIGTALLDAVLRKPVMVRSGTRMLAAELIATGIKSVIKPYRPHSSQKGDRERQPSLLARRQSRSRGKQFPVRPYGGRSCGRAGGGAGSPAFGAARLWGCNCSRRVQIPRGKHYVLDVIADSAIGYIADAGAALLLRAGGRAWRATYRSVRPDARNVNGSR